MVPNEAITRREFGMRTAASGLASSVLSGNVTAKPGRVAPNDRLNVALVGAGTQGLKLLDPWLLRPELQFVAVCDPNRESSDYPRWGKSKKESVGAAGGREVGRRRVNDFYEKHRSKGTYQGCAAYADFRDLLEQEEHLDAVFIVTPDHLHATIALAAMKKKIKVGSHKPISNFMNEVRLTCDTARETGVSTQMFAFKDYLGNYAVEHWIEQGAIGKVKELHRWTNRPMWPQGSPYLPSNTPPVPRGFDWDLWLGPSVDRVYSPDYTHTVFRGWYEFGGGCLADMGYYGFWVDWRILGLGVPLSAEANATFNCEVRDFRSTRIPNDLSYPNGATIRWDVPAKGQRENIDVFWYEGGIRPRTPRALIEKKKSLSKSGVMFVGEKGIILAGYAYENPQLLEVDNADDFRRSFKSADVALMDQTDEMIEDFRGGKRTRGDFVNAQAVAESICLGNLAIRVGGRVEWDAKNMKVTNMPDANQYVRREYREGWEL